jgi:rod shape-determining protein MreC
MHSFLHRYRVALSCGFFLTVSLLLATANTRTPYNSIDPVGVLLLEAMHPLQLGVTVLSQGVERLWTRYLALLSLEQENLALRKKLDELESVSRRVVELDLANRRLEKLLALRDSLEGRAVAARIVGRSSISWVHTVVLDKGERHGVAKGMAVLAPEGVVGQVVSVSAHAARVLLISDPNSGVDALVQRTRVRGIVTGTLDGGCVLKYIQRGDEVEVGDTVITSGLDGVFPKGQPIGTVTWVETKDSRMFQDVEVKLSAELTKVEEVLVVAPTVVRAGE